MFWLAPSSSRDTWLMGCLLFPVCYAVSPSHEELFPASYYQVCNTSFGSWNVKTDPYMQSLSPRSGKSHIFWGRSTPRRPISGGEIAGSILVYQAVPCPWQHEMLILSARLLDQDLSMLDMIYPHLRVAEPETGLCTSTALSFWGLEVQELTSDPRWVKRQVPG